jgi:hypothetical protein
MDHLHLREVLPVLAELDFLSVAARAVAILVKATHWRSNYFLSRVLEAVFSYGMFLIPEVYHFSDPMPMRHKIP